jgi:hypothetical protein
MRGMKHLDEKGSYSSRSILQIAPERLSFFTHRGRCSAAISEPGVRAKGRTLCISIPAADKKSAAQCNIAQASDAIGLRSSCATGVIPLLRHFSEKPVCLRRCHATLGFEQRSVSPDDPASDRPATAFSVYLFMADGLLVHCFTISTIRFSAETSTVFFRIGSPYATADFASINIARFRKGSADV